MVIEKVAPIRLVRSLTLTHAVLYGLGFTLGSAGYLSVFLDFPASGIIALVVPGMGIVACLSTVQSVTVASIMTLVEVSGLLAIVAAGLEKSSDAITRLPEIWPASGDIDVWAGLSGTTLIAVFAFTGFEHLVNAAGEMNNPSRTLARALFMTLGLTALVYALVAWIALVAVPPRELVQSAAPSALVFERTKGMPLMTMSVIAVVATLDGVIAHVIMIARVLCGLAAQSNLPQGLTRLNPMTDAPFLATAIGAAGTLMLAPAVPLAGLAGLTERFTLAIFVIANVALIRTKSREEQPPSVIFTFPRWVPYAGLISCFALLLLDQVAR